MADRRARVHTNKSNRATKHPEHDSKVVYRSVLDNPFRVSWPRIPENVQNAVLSQTLILLDGLSSYHLARAKCTRKSPKANSVVDQDQEENMDVVQQSDETPSTSAMPNMHTTILPVPPPVVQHMSIGINAVTRMLERLAKALRQPPAPNYNTDIHCSTLVLVCRNDVNPPQLIDHIPSVVAACNSAIAKTQQTRVWLVTLPSGAETLLSNATGLRRVAALSIATSAPGFEILQPFLDSIAILRAAWLRPISLVAAPAFIPTHIKQLRTTAPKDMKAAKERRLQGRADAKKRKVEKQKSAPKTTPLAKPVVLSTAS